MSEVVEIIRLVWYANDERKGVYKMNRLSKSELEIMEAIWEAETPMRRIDLEETFKDKNWTRSTLLTFLSRMEKKGYIGFVKKGKYYYYISIISKKKYLSQKE